MKSTLDRREFLTLGAGAFAATFVIPGVSFAQETKTLVSCVASDLTTMNSALFNDIVTLQVSSPVHSYLVHLDADGNAHPDLAERWEVSEDGKVFTFHLRQGVKFHDGELLTSADVKFSLEEMVLKSHSTAMSAYTALTSIETPDDHTVVMTFSRPNFPLMRLQYAFGPISPKRLWEGTDFRQNPYAKAPVGTGPFRFVEYKTGEYVRYVRNEDYFMEGKPHFDELIIRIIPDAASRAAAFESGEVDCLWSANLPFNDVPRLKKMAEVSTGTSFYSGGAWMAYLNNRKGPLATREVRLALAHAIDRKFIRETLMPEIGQEMVGPLYPNSPLYNANLKDYALDTTRANELLDAAGFPRDASGNRFSLNFVFGSTDNLVSRMGDIIAQNLKAVGIGLNLIQLETQAVIQRMVDGEYDIMIRGNALGPDPDFGMERLYSTAYIKPIPNVNNVGYSNPEVDKLFDEQRMSSGLEQRKQVYDKIQELIWNDVPMLSMCAFPTEGLYWNSRVSEIYHMFTPLGEHFGDAKPA
jgi:peptide/nickel transport system substrate-binding protein